LKEGYYDRLQDCVEDMETSPERRLLRDEWHSGALRVTTDCDVMFPGRDNELAGPGTKRRHRDWHLQRLIL